MTGFRKLGGRRRFGEVITSGRSVADGCFVVLFRPSAMGLGAVGIAAGRRLGGAVIRNRIRRRVREGIRTNLHWIPENTEIVVLCRSRSLNLSHEQMLGSLSGLFSRVRRLCPSRESDPRCDPS